MGGAREWCVGSTPYLLGLGLIAARGQLDRAREVRREVTDEKSGGSDVHSEGRDFYKIDCRTRVNNAASAVDRIAVNSRYLGGRRRKVMTTTRDRTREASTLG